MPKYIQIMPTSFKNCLGFYMVIEENTPQFSIKLSPLHKIRETERKTMAYQNNQYGYSTLEDALNNYTVDGLKTLLGLVPHTLTPKRKAEYVTTVKDAIFDNLQQLWQQCKSLEQDTIREAIYSPLLAYDATKIEAKYGATPDWGRDPYYSWRKKDKKTPLLKLFFYNQYVPEDLAIRLKKFVKKPKEFALKVVTKLPQTYQIPMPSWRKETEIF